MLKFIKDWTLPLAMLTGILTYPWVSRLIFLTPYLIFVMLLVTFCKISPRELRFRKEHLWLILIQVIGCLVVYGLLYAYDPIVAQGAMICVLVPTATSAPVITGMLGGNVAFLTSYLLVCNLVVAFVAPTLFPLIGPHAELPFIEAFLYICSHIGPILVLPLFLSWVIQKGLPKVREKIVSIHRLTFYIWAFALIIVTGTTVNYLVMQENPDYKTEISLAVASLVICCFQFWLGRRIGRRYGDPVSSGQGLGQKNTVLAIWMAQTYLNPLSSLAPAAYVLWQNIINSYQLWAKSHSHKKFNK